MTEPKKETPQEKNAKEEAAKQHKGDSLSPDQKYKNYQDDIERLHNEP
jgi:hypothetical protein